MKMTIFRLNQKLGYTLALILLASTAKADSWTDHLALKGDFRYRHELIDEQGKEERNRHRIRARLGFYAAVHQDLQLGF